MRVLYNGNTRPFQGRATGSIPVTRLSSLKNSIALVLFINPHLTYGVYENNFSDIKIISLPP